MEALPKRRNRRSKHARQTAHSFVVNVAYWTDWTARIAWKACKDGLPGLIAEIARWAWLAYDPGIAVPTRQAAKTPGDP
jgi:hypothetical protein